MAAMVQRQHMAQDVRAARIFWDGLVSHGPLKRFFEWCFECLAIVTIPAIIACSIVIAGALSAPTAFASAAGQGLINLAIILMNAAIEGAMLGCAVAARHTGYKRLYWTAIVFLVLTIATIGFAVFHVDAQWSQVLLWVRCSVALVYALVSHMSGGGVQPLAQPAPVVPEPMDYQEMAHHLLPLIVAPIQQTNGVVTQELRGEIGRLSEQVMNLQTAQITEENETEDETEDETEGENIVDIQSYRQVEEVERNDEIETGPTPRITVKLNTIKSETKREINNGRGTARQKALRIIGRNPDILPTDLAKKAGITPQYASQILKKQGKATS